LNLFALVALVLIGLLLDPGDSYAQDAPSRPAIPEEQPTPLVARVDYAGNETFSDYDLFLRTRVRANREFLGIAGLRWWLWVYRLGESGKLGNRLGRALTASGEAPALYDQALVDGDVERLIAFYRQEGFRSVRVSADTAYTSSGWVHVTFSVVEGPPSFLRQISYEGLHVLSPRIRAEFLKSSPISHDASTVHDSSYYAVGERYSEPKLVEERRRILSVLHNNGFAGASRDSVRAVVIPVRPDSFDVRLEIGGGRMYRFGDVRFLVAGPELRRRPRQETIRDDTTGHVSVEFANENKLSAALLRRALRFQPGDVFNQSRVLATKRRLEASGVFAFTNVIPERRTATGASDPRLDYLIELRTRERHSFRSQWFMLQRGGALGGADAELGMGIGVSYRNANLLGSGEAFSIGTSGSMAADSDFKLFTSTQAEISFGLSYPYLIAPFRRLERAADFYNVGTRLSLSLLTARRDQLKLIVRGRGDARLRLEMQHSPTVFSLIDVIDISLSNPDTLAGFADDFLDPLLESIKDDPVQRAQIIEDYTQPQVNDAVRYTYRSALVNPLKRDAGYSYEASFEVGGLANLGLDRYVFSPGELEGSLPGLPFFKQDGSSQRLLYRPYIRLVADFRQYRRVSPTSVFAWKVIGGVAHPISMNEVVPFDRRFFAGGAFSVRGWRLGELGPGDASLATEATTSEATNILGGDIKLEGSLEFRHTVFKRVLAAEWILAPFIDAGNVWFGPRNPGLSGSGPGSPTGKFRPGTIYREIGVGAGVGLRIAWEYLIVRFDLAVPVFDPARRDLGILPDGLRRPLPHFGIGHTF
jgi:outer membrane protein assembly factor BamA